MYKIEVQRKKFQNGLRLINITGLPVNSVTISAFIKSGFKYDPGDIPGLAHFTEHMLFNGTKSFPTPVAVAKAVEEYGGWHGAFTWIEHQKHSVHVPETRFREGLKLLMETISSPIIKEDEIELERGVIIEEILSNKADSYKAVLDYAFMPLYFKGTHLARPYSGKEVDVKKIGKKNIEDFINNFFTPENTVILIAGNLRVEEFDELIYEQINNYDRKGLANLPPIKLSIPKKIYVDSSPRYQQASVVVGVKTESYNSPDRDKIQFIQKLISGGFSSTLIQDLRSESGLIYGWNSYCDFIEEGGYYLFRTSCANKNIEKVISIVVKEYLRIGKGEISLEEFNSTKGFVTGSLLANTETGVDYIDLYGEQELFYPEKVLGLYEKIDMYNKMSFDEIKETAARYFKNDNIFIAVAGNVKENTIMSILS